MRPSSSSASAVFAASFAVATIGAQSPPSTRNPAASPEQRTARYFERIRLEPPALRAFLRAMPKGADLHSHLTGAVYAESYIEWAAVMPLCIDLSTSRYVEAPCRDDGSQRPAADALLDPVLYRRVIDALSTRFWNPSKQPGHYQFFDSFRTSLPSSARAVARRRKLLPGPSRRWPSARRCRTSFISN